MTGWAREHSVVFSGRTEPRGGVGLTGDEWCCVWRMLAPRGVAFSTFLAAEAGHVGAEVSWMHAVEDAGCSLLTA